METTELEAYQHQSCVRGHHIYKGIWSSTVGEKLKCEREPSSGRDPYAVTVYKRDQVVGHIQRIIPATCSVFIQRGGSIDCTITGPRRFSVDLPQGGLEIPCLLKFRGDGKDIKKVIKLLNTAEKMVTAEQEANKRKPEESPDPEAKKIKLNVNIIDRGNRVLKPFFIGLLMVMSIGCNLSVQLAGICTETMLFFSKSNSIAWLVWRLKQSNNPKAI